MKYLLIIGDGMADYPIKELNGKTPLQVAYKPNIDSIAAKGRCGLIKTVPDDMTPGSDVAILSVLGYDPRLYCNGRGALEAPARGISLKDNDSAFRCNLITEKNGLLVDYSAGHISSNESSALIKAIKNAYEKPGVIEFFAGLDYRHFLVLRDYPNSSLINCTPPHDAIGMKITEILPQAKEEKAEAMTELLRNMIMGSKEVLEHHSVNVKRKNLGKRPGNMIWPWGGGSKPFMPRFIDKYGLQAAVISAVDLVKGIGIYAGMEIIEVQGATGLHNTNYEGKADAALKALESKDFVFVHVEAPDEAGHVKDSQLKVKTIEDLDSRLVGRILAGLKEPCTITVLPDHPTPISLGTHTRDPVPFSISSPALTPDMVEKFDEVSAGKGSFGLVKDEFLTPLMLSTVANNSNIQ